MSVSTLAGIAGAIGALGIVFAIKNGGKPLLVAPLVFAGAPVMNTFVSMLWDKPVRMPDWRFFLGIVLAGVGVAMVLRFKPETADAHRATQIKTVASMPEQTTT
jgi:drug/metabolite transporter (DMT)-like permease